MTARRLDSLKTPGRYRADQTLYLIVEPSGSRHWVQRLVVDGRRRDLGLGSYPWTSLAEARERAYENRKVARQGGDPVPRPARVPTFRQAAARVEAASQWRGERTAANRRAAFEMYCGEIMDRRVDRIDRAAVLAILSPIWIKKRPTARNLRGWIRGVLAWAQAHGHVEHNVAGEMIAGALPRNGNTREHHAAVPYQDVPAALEAIENGTPALSVRACLRFVVLTAVRSGEARRATWEEIDADARTWTIPADRMKAAKGHRVPLSDAALAVLESVRPLRGPSGLVFPSGRDRVLAPSSLLKTLHAATGTRATTHGFRSSFRDWCSEQTDAPHAVAEMALAHAVGSDVERSYARSDLFDRRRRLMADWAAFLASDGGKVMRLDG